MIIINVKQTCDVHFGLLLFEFYSRQCIIWLKVPAHDNVDNDTEMKTLAECYYGNTRDNVRAIYNTLCIGDNFRPYIRQFSTIYTTIFDHIYDNFRPHIRQFSTKIFVHISKPDCLSPLIFLSSTNEWWGKNYLNYFLIFKKIKVDSKGN